MIKKILTLLVLSIFIQVSFANYEFTCDGEHPIATYDWEYIFIDSWKPYCMATSKVSNLKFYSEENDWEIIETDGADFGGRDFCPNENLYSAYDDDTWNDFYDFDNYNKNYKKMIELYSYDDVNYTYEGDNECGNLDYFDKAIFRTLSNLGDIDVKFVNIPTEEGTVSADACMWNRVRINGEFLEGFNLIPTIGKEERIIYNPRTNKIYKIISEGEFNDNGVNHMLLLQCEIRGKTDSNGKQNKSSIDNSYPDELKEAYSWAFQNGITTQPTIEDANMYGEITRAEMAKMISSYGKDILGLKPMEDLSAKCTFRNINTLTPSLQKGILRACALGLMGQDGSTDFRPNDKLTRGEFGTLLSRTLRGTKYEGGNPYYKNHLNALKEVGIMNNISNPNSHEIRGRVMLMLMRSVGKNKSSNEENNSVSEKTTNEYNSKSNDKLNKAGQESYLYIDSNGITIKSKPNAEAGNYYYLNGEKYYVAKGIFDIQKQIEDNFPANRIVTTKVTDMEDLFKDNTSFNEDISSWDTSNVTNMNEMFRGATLFNQPLNDWNTHNVKNMSRMFQNTSSFNQDLDNWDTSKVENMSFMFSNSRYFNGKIGLRNTSKVKTMDGMFYQAKNFNQNISDWNVINVTNMGGMFYDAISFNQPLNNRNVINVTDMDEMFKNAQSFNQPLNNRDLANIGGMNYMFYGASSFDQDISNWDVHANHANFDWGTPSTRTEDEKPHFYQEIIGIAGL